MKKINRLLPTTLLTLTIITLAVVIYQNQPKTSPLDLPEEIIIYPKVKKWNKTHYKLNYKNNHGKIKH